MINDNKYIKSPINYTGNKLRILSQIEKYFPKECDVFVDLFSGGATVGFNVNAKKIIMIDSNERVINLLKTLASQDFKKIIIEIEKNIKKYNLSYSMKTNYKTYRNEGYVFGNNGLKEYNKAGYYKLREDYNKLKNKNSFKANILLYVLMVYGFNNDIRFNSLGEYNLPVGKTDFNKNNYNKILEFNNKAKTIDYEFICEDFRSEKVKEILLSANFIYCDPPYLITTAVYNEGNGWNKKNEKELLDLLKELDNSNKSFALSNVIRKQDSNNELLINWCNENGYTINRINYHYKSSSYNKKNRSGSEEEVLITNGGVHENQQ